MRSQEMNAESVVVGVLLCARSMFLVCSAHTVSGCVSIMVLSVDTVYIA